MYVCIYIYICIYEHLYIHIIRGRGGLEALQCLPTATQPVSEGINKYIYIYI